MEVTLVEHSDVIVVILYIVGERLHLIDVVKRYLHTTGSRTQHLGARGSVITRGTDEVEDARTILLHEVLTGILSINVVEQIANHVCQQLRTVIVGRSELEAEIGSGEIELILHLDIVGQHEIVVEPLVKGCRCLVGVNDGHGSIEDGVSEVILCAARCKRYAK